MRITGDDSKLGALIRRLEGAQDAIKTAAAEAALPVLRALVKRCFDSGTAPDGSAWAPLKVDPGRTPLQGLFDALVFEVTGGQVSVTSGKSYAFFHETGTSRGLPARPFLPAGSQALPDGWRVPLAGAIREAVARVLR